MPSLSRVFSSEPLGSLAFFAVVVGTHLAGILLRYLTIEPDPRVILGPGVAVVLAPLYAGWLTFGWAAGVFAGTPVGGVAAAERHFPRAVVAALLVQAVACSGLPTLLGGLLPGRPVGELVVLFTVSAVVGLLAASRK